MTPTPITNKAMRDCLEIDGAMCRLYQGRLQYQPRCRGDLLWNMWTRDRAYDGWTFDLMWAPNADALSGSSPVRVEPEFDPSSIGWSCAQEMRAKTWAADIIATKNIATKFAAE